MRQSEERYRRLVELSPEAIGVVKDDRVVFVNAAGVRLLGAGSSAEILGRVALKFVHFDSRADLTERFRRKGAKQTPVMPVEARFLRTDGGSIDVEMTAVPISYGDEPAIQVILRDITERKELARVRLREQQEREIRFDAIVRSMGEGVLVIDSGGAVQFANAAALGFLGKADSDVVGKPVRELVDAESWHAFFEPIVFGEETAGIAELAVTNDGAVRYLNAHAERVNVPGGDHSGCVCVLTPMLPNCMRWGN